MAFGIFFNLIPIFIVCFGLYILVKKELMELEKNEVNAQALRSQGGEKVHPAFHLFLYLSMFFSLGFLIGGMLTSLYQFVNKYIPDTSNINEFNASVFDDALLKIGLSMLFVASIVYFIASKVVNKKLIKGDIRSNSLVRKFLTYIALFILVAISIGSLVALVFNYLNGELTGNTFGKIAAFFVVSGFFALFYFWEIRRKELTDKKFDILYFITLAAVIIVLVFGVIIADSPQMTREKKLDENRVMEMQNINNNVGIFFNNNKRLPKADEIEKSAKFPIEYKIENDKIYYLCTDFLHLREKTDLYDKQWNHSAGAHCFKLNIDERQVKEGIQSEAL